MPAPAAGDSLAPSVLDARDAGALRGPGPDRVWASTEYLLWWIKGSPLPPGLVTTGSPFDANPGALGQPGTSVLLGGPLGPNLELNPFSGVRTTVGVWVNQSNDVGVEASGFILPWQTKSFQATSNAIGNPVLAFRYLDPPVGGAAPVEDAFQASIPPNLVIGMPQPVGPFAGALAVVSQSRFYGWEANAVGELGREGGLHLQVLGGFRSLNLTENLDLLFQRMAILNGMVSFEGTTFAAPDIVGSVDSFQTRNDFYGGQLGLRGEYCMGNLFVGFAGKVAVGDSHEVVNVSGSSSLTSGSGNAVPAPGGLFAQPSNIGRTTHDMFAVVPEATFQIGYQFNSIVRGFIGYNVIYWSDVARPGSQVDLIVDTTQVRIDPGFNPNAPKAVYPRPQFERSDFWAQGINFGLEFRF